MEQPGFDIIHVC